MIHYKYAILSILVSFSIIGMEQGDNDNSLALRDVIENKEGDYPIVNAKLVDLWMLDHKNIHLISDLSINKNDLAFDINTVYLYQDEVIFLCAVEDGNEKTIDGYLNNTFFLQKASGSTLLASYLIAKEKKDDLLCRKIVKIWKMIPWRRNSQ